MMNIKNGITTRLITAYLTDMIIAPGRAASLSRPVWAIIVSVTAIIVWVIFSHAINGHLIVVAFLGTESAAAQSNLMGCCLIFFTAVFAYSRDVDLRLPCVWFRLSCRKFRTALRRAKAWMAIGPFFKFFTAPVTNENGSLGRITLCPSIGQTTSFRAIMLLIFRARYHFKGFTAIATLLLDSFLLSQSIAFLGTIFPSRSRPLGSPGRDFKLLSAIVTG